MSFTKAFQKSYSYKFLTKISGLIWESGENLLFITLADFHFLKPSPA